MSKCLGSNLGLLAEYHDKRGIVKLRTPMFLSLSCTKQVDLQKIQTSGNVLSIMLTLSFKNSDQQMIGNCDFLNRLSDTDMTDASDHSGQSQTNRELIVAHAHVLCTSKSGSLAQDSLRPLTLIFVVREADYAPV